MAATEIRSNTVKSVSVAQNPNTIPSWWCGGRTSADSVTGAEWRRHRGEAAQETPATSSFLWHRGGAAVQKENRCCQACSTLAPSSMLFLQRLYLALVGCWELPLQQRGMKGLTLCSRDAHKKKSSAALGSRSPSEETPWKKMLIAQRRRWGASGDGPHVRGEQSSKTRSWKGEHLKDNDPFARQIMILY